MPRTALWATTRGQGLALGEGQQVGGAATSASNAGGGNGWASDSRRAHQGSQHRHRLEGRGGGYCEVLGTEDKKTQRSAAQHTHMCYCAGWVVKSVSFGPNACACVCIFASDIETT